MRSNGLRPIELAAVPARLPDIAGLGGAFAGLGGGLAMVAVAMLFAIVSGQDMWLEMKQIAAVVFGAAAMANPGFDAVPVLTGTVIHLVVSITLGALFGIVTRRWLHLPSDLGAPVLTGLIYGLAIWMVAFFIVLPVVDPYLLETYAPAFIIQHIVYGVVTGLIYAWLRPAPYYAPTE